MIRTYGDVILAPILVWAKGFSRIRDVPGKCFVGPVTRQNAMEAMEKIG